MAETDARDPTPSSSNPSPPVWLQRLDAAAIRTGDRLNPILVKETRQALKSRQFVVTFSVVLFAALGWTVIGSLSMMPQIYTTPSAPRMLIGYYVVLAVPMLLVVPLAAYRSLEGEIDDGTLELLSITTLSPWQIVLGKLSSAMLQMLLYFVALFPCVAYAYTLRGVDFPTTLFLLGSLSVVGVFLTIVGLFFAPLARSRTGRISTLLITMLVLLLAQWGLAVAVIGVILEGNPLSVQDSFYAVLFGTVSMAAAGHLLLTATAAQLTPASENRSTAIRVSLLMFTAILVALAMVGWRLPLGGDPVTATTWVISVGAFLGALWLFAGSLMAAESNVITPRIRRELPGSFLGRVTLTYLTPGPTTGLVLACVVGCCLVGMFYRWMSEVLLDPSTPSYMIGEWIAVRRTAVLVGIYAVAGLVAVRAVMVIIRINNQPRVETGMAALAAVGVLSSLVPYSVGLHWNDYRPYSYSAWQATNWAWSINEVYTGRRYSVGLTFGLAVAAAMGLACVILMSPKLVFPRRIATPRRVLEERRMLDERRAERAGAEGSVTD